MPQSHVSTAGADAMRPDALPPPASAEADAAAHRALSEVMPPATYRPPRQHAFPSEGSLQWYIRRHRSELARAGAIVVIAGRLHIHASHFDEFVLRTGAAEAAERCA